MTEIKTTIDFDPDALRTRYKAERDKRIRSDGNEQYLEATGTFSHFSIDNRGGKIIERDPLSNEVDVVVIGGGFGGLIAGARLKNAGIDDVLLIEKGADFGGTWYWNQYPGARCDVESYIYLPLLEEVDKIPSEKYASATEIQEHARAIANRFDLDKDVCFQTEVKSTQWNADTSRWTVVTDRGDAIKARFVVMASGPLHKLKLPGIEGIDTFAGHVFHTSRWDYDYTGGSPNDDLTGLADKRVALIGTGATAIQCVSHLGKASKHLYVFQRTPSSVDFRGNRPTDAEWAGSLEPGWHKERMENFNNLVSGIPQEVDLVDDCWTDLIGNIADMYRRGAVQPEMDLLEVLEMANFEKMESIRKRVEESVDDPEIAEALKPWYALFCKRPCFDDEYLPTFNRENVDLIDTGGLGVEKITSGGVVVAGEEYEVDCIIFATGFEVGTGYERRAGCQVVGADGRTLTEKWDEHGVSTLHGLQTSGYPNYFMLGANQGAFTVNFPHLLDEAATNTVCIIKHTVDEGYLTVDVVQEAEDEWVKTIVEKARGPIGSGPGSTECTPGYYNNEGHLNEKSRQGAPYGGGSVEFFKLMEGWRDDGDFKGLKFN
ncbi:MAG: NAD(P)/FAD-dependent oxidoreductase [Acidimicrobiales bacterium]|nr:NAD(P)/FAD-dependent oxidoreductase [Acidimicrobiales bacterium]